MDMDFGLFVLLLVLTVHCQGVNIGQGHIKQQTVAPAVVTDQGRVVFPAVTKIYTRFSGWRYIPGENDMIKDIYESLSTMGLTKCLKECHQHNQGSATKCIAVNWCAGRGYAGQSEKCQLETDTAEFISNLYKTHSRCILLSTGLVRGENLDSIVKQDHKWDHFVEVNSQRT